ncbi:type II secretion system F family protein [Actinoplanes sp. CA-131856]
MVSSVALSGRTHSSLAGLSGQLPSSVGSGWGRARLSPVWGRVALSVGIAVAVAGFVGTWWGLLAGAVAGVGAERLLRRREPAEVRRERLAAAADLPLGADLLAAALRAGAPVDQAVAAVADALDGPLGVRLRRTARSLQLGAAPDEAWAHLNDITGAHRLVAAAVRSSASGGALAGALARLSGDLRAGLAAAVEARAQRAAVLIVLPLGVCFLPAFFLAGLVPVMTSVLEDVL